jgi:hypothetical protein
MNMQRLTVILFGIAMFGLGFLAREPAQEIRQWWSPCHRGFEVGVGACAGFGSIAVGAHAKAGRDSVVIGSGVEAGDNSIITPSYETLAGVCFAAQQAGYSSPGCPRSAVKTPSY